MNWLRARALRALGAIIHAPPVSFGSFENWAADRALTSLGHAVSRKWAHR